MRSSMFSSTITTFIAPGLSSVNVLYNGVGEQPYDVTYNAATGELSFKTKHFSQYIVTTPDEAYDDTAKKGYATLSAVAAAVNDGFATSLRQRASTPTATNWLTPVSSARWSMQQSRT